MRGMATWMASASAAKGRGVLAVPAAWRHVEILIDEMGVGERAKTVQGELDGFDPGWCRDALRVVRHQQQVARVVAI